ncbi:hypothetical protein DMP07_05260 [Slackia faecicanis]|uniref:Uncharacterized protein n=1 Tax=Slackia faecicanis TaxID=255723 RepID=A0A3N0AGM3_9ACTN|nr:hypothetical protein [Slackia faecicanis]RNL19782.1 hypothetical protein DMP07_05260 [Slackia faecicanis]
MKALLPVGCNERTAFASDAPSAILPFWARALISCLLDENRSGGGCDSFSNSIGFSKHMPSFDGIFRARLCRRAGSSCVHGFGTEG